MKPILIALAALALTGCASLDNAGHSAYSLTAVKGKDGQVAGYDLVVKDGKEFAGREIRFRAIGQSVTVHIAEGEGKAFKGQGIAAKAAAVLPVTGLQELAK